MSEEKLVVGNAVHLEHFFPGRLPGFNTFKSFWSSPDKIADYIESIHPSECWHTSAWDSHDSGWAGTKTMEEAIRLIREGWKEGIELVERMQRRILARYPISKRRVEFDVVGDVPSVARAVSGNPKNMRKPDPHRSRRRPIITLISDMAATCGHEPVELINRAAAVAAIIDHVEAAGHSVEVVAVAYSQSTKHEIRSHVMVKESHQPVDIARLAFGLGHAAMFRRIIFADWSIDDFNKPLGRGLGYNHKIKLGTQEQKDLEEKHMYVVGSVEYTRNIFLTEESTETHGLNYLLAGLKYQKFPALDFSRIRDLPLDGDGDPKIAEWLEQEKGGEDEPLEIPDFEDVEDDGDDW